MTDKPVQQAAPASGGAGYNKARDERALYARLAALEVKVDAILERSRANAERITSLERERNQMLLWGVLSLGAAVVGLVAFVAIKLSMILPPR